MHVRYVLVFVKPHSTSTPPVSMCSSSSFSPDESSRARRLLASIAQLQPLIFGLSEELLATSLELNASRLEGALENLTQQVKREEAEQTQQLFKIMMPCFCFCHLDRSVCPCSQRRADKEGTDEEPHAML